MSKFDWTKALRTMFWIAMAAGVGIGAVADDIDWAEFDFSLGAFSVLLYGAARVAVGWYRKSVPSGQRTGILRVLTVLLVAGLLAGGCAMYPGMENMLQSRDTLKIKEPDFKLTIKGSGDGVFDRNVHYQGEGVDPWILSVTDKVEITSPALLAAVNTAPDLFVLLPPTLQQILGEPPPTPEGRKAWWETLLAMMNSDSGVLGTVLPLIIGLL